MADTPDIEGLVRYVVTSLVDEPEAVEITRSDEDDVITFEVSVDSADIGKVIGRQGRIIKAIRTLARAAGSLDDVQVEVEVLG
jgi:predicted RNA-binding protein YlqC (UPF0109 family)